MFPNDTQMADWLKWFVADNDYNGLDKWFILADGRRCATDMRQAVITSLPSETNQIPGEAKESIKDNIPKILSAPASIDAIFNYADLVTRIGPHKSITTVTCPNCKGKKTRPHHCYCELCEADTESCEECDETGTIDEYPADEQVLIFGTPFDLHRVSYIFAHCPAATDCRVELTQFLNNKILRIVTDHWTAILVALTLNNEEREVLPNILGV